MFELDIFKECVSSEGTMSSRDLHKFVYACTGKYEEIKTFNRKVKTVLFGTETPTKAQIMDGTTRVSYLPNGYIDCFNLDEVECIEILHSFGLKVHPIHGLIKILTPAIRGHHEHGALCAIEQLLNIELIRQFRIGKYRIDGYCVETNTVYEIDEAQHKGLEHSIADDVREEYIKRILKCEFVRIDVS